MNLATFRRVRDELALEAYAARLPRLLARESEIRLQIEQAAGTMSKTEYKDAQHDKSGLWYELQYVTAQIEGIKRDSLRRKRGYYRRFKRHVVAARIAGKDQR